IKNGEEFIGGIPPSSHHKPGVPAHWMAYFAVSDCDATAAEAKNLGAMLYLPPTDFEDVGRISIMADPQGAALAIFKAAAQRASAGVLRPGPAADLRVQSRRSGALLPARGRT